MGFFILALGCLALAIVWSYVWPKDRTPESLKQLPAYQPRSGGIQRVLRWFHTLAWVMLAAMFCFLGLAQTTLASAAALTAGIMYVTFLVALLKDGQRQKALKHEGPTPYSNHRPGA